MWSQPTLLDGGLDAPRARRFEPERLLLDERSWVDLAPGWLEGADHAFAELAADLPWFTGERVVYHQRHVEPRRSAGWDDPGEHPLSTAMRDALEARYGRRFHVVFCNLYRDGDDAVAWHRDRIHRSDPEPLVAILTLGATRTFSLRPLGGGSSTRLRPASGDLLVMGGRSQHEWEHAVLRTRRPVGPRISVTLRAVAPTD
ncbi:MAG: alpha-ketoglutarate-dependent dioxygenase AlkB [Actinomycetota bacterium]